MSDLDILTLLKVVIGPLLLAAALIYGIVKYRQRSQAMKQLTEETTRDLYQEGARQEHQESPPLADPVPPSSAVPPSWDRQTKQKQKLSP